MTDKTDGPAESDELMPERSKLLPWAIGAVVVGVLAASVGGYLWYRAAHDEALVYSQARDDVLRVGQQAVLNFNTMDYHNAEEGLKRWDESATGTLKDELQKDRASQVQAIQKAKAVTTATVTGAAVTELDVRAGKASIMVSLRVKVVPEGQTPDPEPKLMREIGQLTRTDGGWKLSSLVPLEP